MKKVYSFIGMYAVFLLQTLVLEKYYILSVTPNLFFSCVMLYAAFSSPVAGGIAGAAAGFLTDAVCGTYFGGYTLMYMSAAVAVSFFTDKRNINSPVIMAWYGFMYTVFFETVRLLSRAFLGGGKTPHIGGKILVNGLLSALVFFFAVLFTLHRKQKSADEEACV